jgi:hypothetical protein
VGILHKAILRDIFTSFGKQMGESGGIESLKREPINYQKFFKELFPEG